MNNVFVRWLIILICLLIPVGYVAWPTNTQLHIPLPDTPIDRDISVRQGLDLQGGLQVLLEADLPADQLVDRAAMETVRGIIENRVNSLGVSEPLVQVAGDRRLVVELPGLSNTEQALTLLRQTALLEFVDTGSTPIPVGETIQTDLETGAPGSGEADPATEPAPAGPIFHTVMTGGALADASVSSDPQSQQIYVQFRLTDEGSKVFAEHTAANIGQYLTIVLDKRVISSPRINAAITGGEGIIEGRFTQAEANNLAIALRYGSLPVPLRLAESRVIGPTLGQDSLNKSLVAGAIGLGAVMIFMLLYYRVPGLTANLSILVYAIIALAVFKLVPVTLTLAGVAGFLLSTGSALDANILIFERLKEELRNGKGLSLAVDQAWRRAWSSIRDSNIATIIICLILLWFASTFGATIVRGFAVTLLVGVAISLFCALVITRVLLKSALALFKPADLGRWFGI